MKTNKAPTTTNRLITVMSPETEWLESEYGKITYRDWCDREIGRFRRIGRKVRLVQDKEGRCGVASVK